MLFLSENWMHTGFIAECSNSSKNLDEMSPSFIFLVCTKDVQKYVEMTIVACTPLGRFSTRFWNMAVMPEEQKSPGTYAIPVHHKSVHCG